jgi:hypothetical protein
VIRTIKKTGLEDGSFAGWFKDIARHGVTCDALND